MLACDTNFEEIRAEAKVRRENGEQVCVVIKRVWQDDDTLYREAEVVKGGGDPGY